MTTYDNEDIPRAISGVLRNLTFKGVTGYVSFDENMDRVGLWSTFRYHMKELPDDEKDDILRPTIEYSLEEGMKLMGDNFPYGVPKDDISTQIVYITPQDEIMIWGISMSGMGVLFACSSIMLNLIFRKRKIIKLSSPNLNTMSCLGSMLIYCSTIVLSGEYGLFQMSKVELSVSSCMIHVWTLAYGFTLMFGSLFAKTFRVHLIFTNISAKQVRISDGKLVMLVFLMLAVDSMIILFWQVFDPMTLTTARLSTVVNEDRDIVYDNFKYLCTSGNTIQWTGGILSFKIFQLLFGAFLAWEVRNVKIKELNDSQFIGSSIYLVSIVCILGVPSLLFVQDSPQSAYICQVAILFTIASIPLTLLTIPKFRSVWNNDVVSNLKTATSTANRQTDVSTGLQESQIAGPSGDEDALAHAREVKILQDQISRLKTK